MDRSQFISILSDYGFKITFANEKNTLFLRKAIQALIQSETPIHKVELSRNEFAGLTKDARAGLYDLICIDEKENTFIVEMQLGEFKQFIQRSKFYAFQRFNTLVIKGDYLFENIPKIYCIGFLAKDIFPYKAYYHFGQLKNQHNEEMDTQLFHIIVEIAKFDKNPEEIKTDLDKLIYTMKHIHKTEEPIQYPEFWNEEWIKIAIEQLNKSNLSPEERMAYEMTLAHNASVVAMIEQEKKEAIEEAVKEAVEKTVKEAVEKTVKEAVEKTVKETVEKMLRTGKFTIEEIATMLSISEEKVFEIQQNKT